MTTRKSMRSEGLPARASLIATMTRLAVAGALLLFTGTLAVEAQQNSKTPLVGILIAGSIHDIFAKEFREAFRQLGYNEGRNVRIVYRVAEGRQDRLPELAAELVASRVDVIVALGPAVWAAKQQTSTIPIVIAFSGDPVGVGIVSSLAHASNSNLTGVSFMSSDLAAKRLELLKQLSTTTKRIAVLFKPDEPSTGPELRQTEAAARATGVTLQRLEAHSANDLEAVFAAAARERADAAIVFAHGFAFVNRDRIIALAARHKLPMMYGWREFVDAGGLVSYGPNLRMTIRRSASFVDRILKGAKPADLPIEQPTTFELVINLKTAKAIGLTVPSSVLVRADEVIE
jgi:putative tryptophan/tyrosine transport system substrate-binding protein